MKIIKLLFTKEDIKYVRRWIICSIGIFIMGMSRTPVTLVMG